MIETKKKKKRRKEEKEGEIKEERTVLRMEGMRQLRKQASKEEKKSYLTDGDY